MPSGRKIGFGFEIAGLGREEGDRRVPRLDRPRDPDLGTRDLSSRCHHK
jgi:hypothetical protein